MIRPTTAATGWGGGGPVSPAAASGPSQVRPDASPVEVEEAPDTAGPAATETAVALRALVITVSTRASLGVYEDRSGPLLVELLGRHLGVDPAHPTDPAHLTDRADPSGPTATTGPGPAVDGPWVVPDGPELGTALAAAVAAGYDAVFTTGGTGFSRDDRTPEATRDVLTLEIPGIAELLRSTGVAAGVPTAVFSRGVAGLAGSTFVVNLPGSTGGVRDGMAVLGPLLGEIVRHARGGSH